MLMVVFSVNTMLKLTMSTDVIFFFLWGGGGRNRMNNQGTMNISLQLNFSLAQQFL